jgi:hypothetical protein
MALLALGGGVVSWAVFLIMVPLVATPAHWSLPPPTDPAAAALSLRWLRSVGLVDLSFCTGGMIAAAVLLLAGPARIAAILGLPVVLTLLQALWLRPRFDGRLQLIIGGTCLHHGVTERAAHLMYVGSETLKAVALVVAAAAIARSVRHWQE